MLFWNPAEKTLPKYRSKEEIQVDLCGRSTNMDRDIPIWTGTVQAAWLSQ